MEVVASLSQGSTAAAQCGLFTHKSVPVIFEPPCSLEFKNAHVPSWHSQGNSPHLLPQHVHIHIAFLCAYINFGT